MDNNFLTNLSNNNKELIICVASVEYKQLAHNWFLNLKKIGLDNQSIVICLDFNILNYLKQNNVNCMHYSENMITTLDVEKIKNFYTLPHEILCVLIVESLFKQYNFNLVLSDVDMIFLKNPFSYFYENLNDDGDCCFFQNIDFKEVMFSTNKTLGNILFYKKTAYYKIQDAINNLNSIDMNNLDLQEIKTNFNLNIKTLNKSYFIHSSFLDVNFAKEIFEKNAYCVHYADTLDKTVKYGSNDNLKICIDRKINDMKKNNHWII